MLAYTTQVPFRLPYPGWEHYYSPYDGCARQPTKQTARDQEPSSEPPPDKHGACANESTVEKTSLARKDSACVEKDVLDVPSWARDVNGIWLMKEIKR